MMDQPVALTLLPGRLAVCRLPVAAEFPDWARPVTLLALVRTHDELSVVCEERFVPPDVKAERSWRAFRVHGPLDFALIGVLAGISTTLAEAGVSIFAISTFDTDYILVKENSVERAMQALIQAGHTVVPPV